MTNEGLCFILGACGGLSIGAIIIGTLQVVPCIYQTIEPLLSEIIELKKKRLRDRYNDEQAANKTARGE